MFPVVGVITNHLKAIAHLQWEIFPCGWCYHRPLESNFHSRKDAKTQWLQLINHLFDLMFLRLCVSARAFIFPASARNSRALLNLIPGTRAALLAYPSRWNTAPSKINLAEGSIFRLSVVCLRTRFLAGNTPEERAEMTYTTEVLLSKNKLLFLQNLIWCIKTGLFYHMSNSA